MRVLFLTYYFEPDLSAGSFRSTALVRALSSRAGDNVSIDVLTTQPNRYSSFKSRAPAIESRPGVNIVRFPLPAHRSGFVDQSFAFVAYSWQVLKFMRRRQYDIVFATSSRLMTAFLGAVVSRWKQVPLYLDIRDIFVDTIQDVFHTRVARSLLLPMFRVIERFTIDRAAHINLVSEGFKDYFRHRYPNQKYSFIPNGIDEEFIDFDFTCVKKESARVIVLYAGNVGEGQGLHLIVPGLARQLQSTHEFWIVGDGGAYAKLQAAVSGLDNVKIMSPVDRKTLMSYYRRSDVLFLHLNDYPAFRKVLPSKMFEYAATGKPILAGVAGYAADFLHQVSSAAVFPPCDVSAGCSALASLQLGQTSRSAFTEKYQRSQLMHVLADEIVATARNTPPDGNWGTKKC